MIDNNLFRCVIAHIKAPKKMTTVKNTPGRPIATANFGRPFIIPLWMIRKVRPVMPIVIRNVFQLKGNFLK